ncbi:MAG: carbon starvation protein A [Ectothiorhodospiraceae bacterium]|nr:carbon starvation protein A [Ectothiorhodospiraceae bacterium]
MNAAFIMLFGAAWLVFAYFWYGGKINKHVVRPNNDAPTPSNALNDGRDYVPTKTGVLFGHHFSSIAGAGPIIGPILAFALFGWLPALIWILVGTVFMGAVHDYTSLMASVRSKGVSIVEIAEKSVSRTARNIFAIFVWVALVLVQAVFGDLTAKTFAEKPEIVLPTLGLVAIALFFGYFVFRRNFNTIAGTVIALAGLGALIYFGNRFPIAASYEFWLIFVFIYAFIAATLPVWTLLQPRDYLSNFLLIGGVGFGFLGLMLLQPEINAPAFISFNSKSGPLFPILFITVACGAVSGFHSLVSSGTSSKQLRTEADGKKIGYGAMLTEGGLALLVIMIISSVLSWDGSAIGGVTGVGFHELLGQSANIVFGTALGQVLVPLGIPLAIGTAFGVLMLNAFILTTLDTTVRLNRYIVQETLGVSKGGIFKNPYITAGTSVILAYTLCLGNGYQALWPVFGASNQLIAALALFVATAYWFGHKGNKWYTLIPGVFMLIVTEAALIYQLGWLYVPKGEWLLSVVSVVLMILGFVVAYEVYRKTSGVPSDAGPAEAGI